jgi:tetratricopeptide (TPR) repeat protein
MRKSVQSSVKNYVAVFVMAATVSLSFVRAASQESATSGATTEGVLQGYVRDSHGKPIADVVVILQSTAEPQSGPKQPMIAHTDWSGSFIFSPLHTGSYALSAEKAGYRKSAIDAVPVKPNMTNDVAVILISTDTQTSTTTAKPAEKPEFFDEPQFTVAGVTQGANSGGHGSDTAIRTTEALAKATVSLGKETTEKESPATSLAAEREKTFENILSRDPDNFDANYQLGKLLATGGKPAEALPYLQRAGKLNPANADVHHSLADVAENLNQPLEAVREYQRAAELDPSEPHLFDWGAELLAHRALEPAVEVFAKGNHLFPNSSRMLVGLGVAWYARGSYDQAAQYLVRASELDSRDPTPYFFLGKIQSVEVKPLDGSVSRFARFAELEPDNALANYYYAISLWKQLEASGRTGDEEGLSTPEADIESRLLKAAHLDPTLGAAQLQLGILYSRRGDFARAVSAFEEAIRVTANDDDTVAKAHYRLAQADVQIGEKAKAQQEFELHRQLAKKTSINAARERAAIQQFVISQRRDASDSAGKH